MVRNNLFVLICILGFGMPICAQVEVGFKAGMHRSVLPVYNLNSEWIPVERTARVSYKVELPVQIKLNENLSFASGLSFMEEGMSFKFFNTKYEFNEHISILVQTVQVPVQFLLGISRKKLRYSISGGVQYSRSLSISAEKYGGTAYAYDITFDNAQLKNWDLAGSIGIELSKHVGKRARIVLDSHYSFGFINRSEQADQALFTNNLSVNIGILFDLSSPFKEE